jgi:thioredoxin 1
MALKVTDSNFEELLNSDKPLVIDFWAEWCGPCRMIAPVIEELASDYEGRVNIGKVDVDNNSEIVSRFGIRNIPTILFFKNGEMADKCVGASSKAIFVEKIEKLLRD